jgi:hypothetical protein
LRGVEINSTMFGFDVAFSMSLVSIDEDWIFLSAESMLVGVNNLHFGYKTKEVGYECMLVIRHSINRYNNKIKTIKIVSNTSVKYRGDGIVCIFK